MSKSSLLKLCQVELNVSKFVLAVQVESKSCDLSQQQSKLVHYARTPVRGRSKAQVIYLAQTILMSFINEVISEAISAKYTSF